MEILSEYSGIVAIFVYSAILYLILKLSKNKGTVKGTDKEENKRVYERLDPEDEDATVACLVAAIDCRNQYHKNVEIVGVRRIS